MKIPDSFKSYSCQEYFENGKYSKGVWSEGEQLWIIYQFQELEIISEINFLALGSPGVDGIEFGYRENQVGLWAYYPINKEFKFMSDTIDELLIGWNTGELTV